VCSRGGRLHRYGPPDHRQARSIANYGDNIDTGGIRIVAGGRFILEDLDQPGNPFQSSTRPSRFFVDHRNLEYDDHPVSVDRRAGGGARHHKGKLSFLSQAGDCGLSGRIVSQPDPNPLANTGNGGHLCLGFCRGGMGQVPARCHRLR
jgi:hypothetical protein